MKNLYLVAFIVGIGLLTTLNVRATTPITGAAQVGTTNGIRLTWGETDVNTSSPDVSLDRYQVSYNLVGQTPIIIDNVSNALREYTITGLTLGQTYEVRVIEVIRVNLPPSPFTPPFLDTFIASEDRTVTLIIPNQPPVARCKNITKSVGVNCQVSVGAIEIDNGSTDPEGGTLTYSIDNGGPFSVGAYIVALTVTDNQNATAICTAVIFVIDDTNPTVVTKNATIVLGNDGKATLTVSQIENGSSDNCGIVSSNLSKTDFTCADIGNQTVTLFVRDAAGNQSSATATVTVVDNAGPTVVTKNATIVLGNDGKATLTIAQIENGSTDNCGIVSSNLSKTDFTCADIGNQTVTLFVRDAAGNQSSATATVTVVDNTAPTAVAKNATIALGNDGKATLTVFQIENGSSDNCGIASSSLSKTEFTCADIGNQTVTLFVRDAAGNQSSATATVTVVDNSGPTVVTKNATIVLGSDGKATLTITQVENGSSDNCGIASSNLSKTDFTCADIGKQTVTLFVRDAAGNQSSATATVTVVDNSGPTVVTKNATIVLGNDGKATLTIAQIENGSFDNCGVTGISLSKTEFTCADIGNKTVTLFVRDAAGNQSSATAIVTVVDNITPTVRTRNVTIALDATGKAWVKTMDIDNGSFDNCGIAELRVSVGDFTCNQVGTQTVTLFAKDASGNESSATATVTIVDNSGPTVVTKNATIILENDGKATLTVPQIENGSFDNCGVTGISLSKTEFTCADLGNQTVTLIVRDAAGNQSSATATVTVTDNIFPTAVAKNATVVLGNDGKATLAISQVENGSFDNCGVTNASLSKTEFSCGDLGNQTVTYFVRDAAGNQSSATATVTVVDNLVPTAVTKNATIALGGDGKVTLAVPQIENGSFDNCGITGISLSKTEFTCADIGNQTVTLFVRDAVGNQSSATATVTIVDNSGPTVVTKNATIVLGNDGKATLTVPQIENGSFDNCGVKGISLSKTEFTCANIGNQTVTLFVRDAAGNQSSATATVTIVDNSSPTVVAKNAIIVLGSDGKATLAVSQIENGSFDNCGISSVSLSKTEFSCGDLGNQTVTYFVRDAAGNQSSATATVTVIDNTAPNVNVKNATIFLGTNGKVTLTIQQIENGLTDNCGVTGISLSKTEFTCADIGSQTVTLFVRDAAGNQSSATATVTVVDNIFPTVVVKNATIILGNDGKATLTVPQIENGSFDNCGVTGIGLSKTEFTCADIGNQTVTLFVRDAAGNQASATATVTIIDNIAPIARTKKATIYLDAFGKTSLSVSQVNDNSSDNCGIASLRLSKTDFNCTETGPKTVTLFVRDGSGNESSATAIVTIIDSIAPKIQVKDLTIFLDSTGKAILTMAKTNAVISDNCGIDSTFLSRTNFDCSVKNQLITLTAIDKSKNIGRVSFLVTVKDTLAPVIKTKPFIAYLNAAGTATLKVSDINNGTADNCIVDTLYLSKTAFSCNTIGSNQLSFFAIDASGNVAEKLISVEVKDTLAPVIKTKPVTLLLDEQGKASLTVSQIENGSTDNCKIATQTLSRQTFDCSTAGVQTIIYTVTDVNGNVARSPVAVTVRDSVPPVLTVKNVTVSLSDEGIANVTADQFIESATDNCGVVTKTVSRTNFNCLAIGTVTVQVSIADGSGNTVTKNATVTISDPLGICPCSYAILASETVDLKDNTILFGGVGTYEAGKMVCIDKSTVDKTKAFVRSEKTELDAESTPDRVIKKTAPKPAEFEGNGFKNKKRLKAKNGKSQTTSDNQFGRMVVGRNATLTLTNNADFYAKKLIIRKGGKLEFNRRSAIHVDKKMRTGNEATINSTNERVKIFVEKDIKVGRCNMINAYVHTLEDVKLKSSDADNPTMVSGIFIARRLKALANVTWEGTVINCQPDEEEKNSATAQKMLAVKEEKPKPEETKLIEETGDLFGYGPNPVRDIITLEFKSAMSNSFSITVRDVMGKTVYENLVSKRTFTNKMTINLNNLVGGMYLLTVQDNGRMQTVKISKE